MGEFKLLADACVESKLKRDPICLVDWNQLEFSLPLGSTLFARISFSNDRTYLTEATSIYNRLALW